MEMMRQLKVTIDPFAFLLLNAHASGLQSR